jgi:hypothetical protein
MARVFTALSWREMNKGVALNTFNTLQNIGGKLKSIVLEESNSGHEFLDQTPLRILIAQIGVIVRGRKCQT